MEVLADSAVNRIYDSSFKLTNLNKGIQMTILINTRSFSIVDAAVAKFKNETVSNKTLNKVGVIANRLCGISNTPIDKAEVNKYAVRSMVNGGEGKFDGLLKGIEKIGNAKAIIEISPTLKAEAKKAFLDKLDKLEKNAIAQAEYFSNKLAQPEEPNSGWPREYMETMLYGREANLRQPTLNNSSKSDA
jgi:hypothetical protein